MKCLLFADDPTLLIHGRNPSELINKTNSGISTVNEWFAHNKLTVHPDKTNFMCFNLKERETLNGKILWGPTKLRRVGKGEDEQSIKYVGIHIDEELNFKIHGKHVINKVRQNSYLISSNKNFLPFSTRKLIYNALVRPYLDYGVELWGALNADIVFKLQKKCIRHVMRCKNHLAHTNEFFQTISTLKFPDLITYHRLRLAHKLVHQQHPKGLKLIMPLSSLVGRTTKEFNLHVERNDRCSLKDSQLPPIRVPAVWNALPENAKKLPKWHQLKKYFCNMTFQEYALKPHCKIKSCLSCKNSRPFN